MFNAVATVLLDKRLYYRDRPNTVLNFYHIQSILNSLPTKLSSNRATTANKFTPEVIIPTDYTEKGKMLGTNWDSRVKRSWILN